MAGEVKPFPDRNAPGKAQTKPRRRAGPYIPRTPGTLKNATRLLITAAGGEVEAAQGTRVSDGQIYRYGSETDPLHMPVDVLHDMQQRTDDATVLEWLAVRMPTLRLVIPAEVNAVECWHQHGAEMADRHAMYSRRLYTALKDNHITREEAAELIDAGMAQLREICGALTELRRVAGQDDE